MMWVVEATLAKASRSYSARYDMESRMNGFVR